MVVFQWAVGITLMVLAVFLVVVVLMQSDKDQRISGTIMGGSDTYYGQNKGKSRDKILARITWVVAIVFTGLVLAMYVMISRYGIGA